MIRGFHLLVLTFRIDGFLGAEFKPDDLTSLSLVQVGAARQKGAALVEVSARKVDSEEVGFCRESGSSDGSYGGFCFTRNVPSKEDCWSKATTISPWPPSVVAWTTLRVVEYDLAARTCQLMSMILAKPSDCPTNWTAGVGTANITTYQGDNNPNGVCMKEVSAPTASPTAEPTADPTEETVTATEDPHMSNIAGAKFNILTPGTYTFIEMPRGAKPGKHQLLVSARIDQLLGKCETGGLYVESINLSGGLLKDVGPLTVDAVSKQIDATDVLHVTTADSDPTTASEFAKRNAGSIAATFEDIDPKRQNLKLETGGIAINIAGRREDIEQPRQMHIDFLDLRISGLGGYHDIGGLLGTDNHTSAEMAPPECEKTSFLVSSSIKKMGSRMIAVKP